METRLRGLLPDGRFRDVTPERSRHMAAIRSSNNRSTERRFRGALVRAGLRGWRLRPPGVLGHPDFLFPGASVVVFVDGCFWHGCPRCGHVPSVRRAFWKGKIERNKERDKRTSSRLRRRSFRVVRLWEHDVQQDLSACVRRVVRALGGQGRD